MTAKKLTIVLATLVLAASAHTAALAQVPAGQATGQATLLAQADTSQMRREPAAQPQPGPGNSLSPSPAADENQPTDTLMMLAVGTLALLVLALRRRPR